MSKRKIEHLPSVVTSEIWQQIRKAIEQEKSKMEEEKLKEETIGYREKIIK